MKTARISTTFLALTIALSSAHPNSSRMKLRKRQYLEWENPGIEMYLPVQDITTPDFTLKVNLPPPITSNSLLTLVDKPVIEVQEYVPPQSIGTAIIPQVPPPATPVNAAAANVPITQGAVFLGSGSLGVVSLGNGAYALGSGSLGYSGNRAQPRPTGSVPVYPPLRASPDLIPAAVPSPAPLQRIVAPAPPYPDAVQSGSENPEPVPILDQNGYEYLHPSRIGFGSPLTRPLRLKTRMQFATPTALQLQPQPQQQQLQGLPSASFDFSNLDLAHFG